MQTDPDADHRFDTDFFGRFDRLLELFEFLDHNDNLFAEFAAEQRNANERFVFVTVANDQALRIFVHRERSDQLRFTAGLESEMKLLAGIDDFLNHLA